MASVKLIKNNSFKKYGARLDLIIGRDKLFEHDKSTKATGCFAIVDFFLP